MLFPKKTIGIILGVSAVGGGAVAVKYWLNNSEPIEKINYENYSEIKKRKNNEFVLKRCETPGKCAKLERTKQILEQNKDVNLFDFSTGD